MESCGRPALGPHTCEYHLPKIKWVAVWWHRCFLFPLKKKKTRAPAPRRVTEEDSRDGRSAGRTRRRRPSSRRTAAAYRHQPPRPRPTRRRQPLSTPRLRLAPRHAHRPLTPPVAAPSPPPPPPLAAYPQVKPITLPAAGTVPTLPPPPPPRSPTAPHLTALPHRANPTQWRRHIAPAPPRLRCPCTTPLSDRTLRTPPPTPCPIMGHTQASLCDRPCLPCHHPPHPPKGASRSRRGPLPPPLSPHLIFRAPSGFTSVLLCRVVCSLPLAVSTLPNP